jgi:transcriptional regulator with XRE-family HTH domain
MYFVKGGERMLRNLRVLREERKISQQKLAEAIGLTQPSINKYENHNIEPDIFTLCRMADYFSTSVDYIIGHTDVRRKIEPVAEFALNEEEQSLIRNWRTLSPEERECILTVMRTLERR